MFSGRQCAYSKGQMKKTKRVVLSRAEMCVCVCAEVSVNHVKMEKHTSTLHIQSAHATPTQTQVTAQKTNTHKRLETKNKEHANTHICIWILSSQTKAV